jgi:hypothetical protein
MSVHRWWRGTAATECAPGESLELPAAEPMPAHAERLPELVQSLGGRNKSRRDLHPDRVSVLILVNAEPMPGVFVRADFVRRGSHPPPLARFRSCGSCCQRHAPERRLAAVSPLPSAFRPELFLRTKGVIESDVVPVIGPNAVTLRCRMRRRGSWPCGYPAMLLDTRSSSRSPRAP